MFSSCDGFHARQQKSDDVQNCKKMNVLLSLAGTDEKGKKQVKMREEME